jgi:hypothetical protein
MDSQQGCGITSTKLVGGIVKRSLAMASLGHGSTIARAFGLDAATLLQSSFFFCGAPMATNEPGTIMGRL